MEGEEEEHLEEAGVVAAGGTSLPGGYGLVRLQALSALSHCLGEPDGGNICVSIAASRASALGETESPPLPPWIHGGGGSRDSCCG